MPWKLTVRAGPRVERARFAELEQAFDALEQRGLELAESAPRRPVCASGLFHQFEPAQQVFARLELAGPERLLPKVRAGIDVRGDGSTEAYVGRITREVVEQRDGETAYKALRRELRAKRPTK